MRYPQRTDAISLSGTFTTHFESSKRGTCRLFWVECSAAVTALSEPEKRILNKISFGTDISLSAETGVNDA
jgi:hypothetical protein